MEPIFIRRWRPISGDQLFLDLFVDRLKPTFGTGRAVSEELDLGL
jgi:hypothetical protein